MIVDQCACRVFRSLDTDTWGWAAEIKTNKLQVGATSRESQAVVE